MVGRDLLVVVEVKTDSIDRASLDQDQEVNTHPEVNPKWIVIIKESLNQWADLKVIQDLIRTLDPINLDPIQCLNQVVKSLRNIMNDWIIDWYEYIINGENRYETMTGNEYRYRSINRWLYNI